jgi:4-amino-4-deoxy-L-arabinose transferase-like glycosyltransferase
MGSMARRRPNPLWLALPLALVYLWGLNAAGVVGPDEPRYAAVARTMAVSGDWITPRLWGQPWFEKPALLYWMSATGFRLGLGPELAPRLPVAVLALAFLAFYWWILRREFGSKAAGYATLILGTSLGWVGFSQIGVTDLPMTAAFAAAMLLALRWIAKGDARLLPAVSALLAVAVLAKGLVPLVLALPLVLRGRLRDLSRWRVVVPFALIGLPWYLWCYLRNGRQFVDVFFWQQQFGRFHSPALQHTQPWWFYIPVLLAGLLPWTPLVFVAARRGHWRDARRAFLIAWVVFGLVFFSLAVNKLPGYMLPLLPAVCALMGVGLAETEEASWPLAAGLTGAALLLALYPLAAGILPSAVARGLSRALAVRMDWRYLLPVGVGVAVWWLARRARAVEAVMLIAASAAAGCLYLKTTSFPEVDRVASARSLWRAIEEKGGAGDVCVGDVHRNFRYGLNYYAGAPLPLCSEQTRPLAVRELPGEPPYIARLGNR